jgi:2-keto-4-pentenoate hydratase/2-oxohepta-3-ene-1,7-dioic acid hydratase in catechol pathway
MPESPLIFFKPPSSLIADGESIVLPHQSGRVEHEAEIAVVIGRRARNVSANEAMSFVGGYAALNDVTARDLQRSDQQWTRAKGFDTFCPLGSITPADGIDFRDLEVVCRVNGELRQQRARGSDGLSHSRTDRVYHGGDDARTGRRHRNRDPIRRGSVEQRGHR